MREFMKEASKGFERLRDSTKVATKGFENMKIATKGFDRVGARKFVEGFCCYMAT